jgi:hypothetical protein
VDQEGLLCNSDLIIGVRCIPFGNQFIAGHANGFAVDDGAAENARDVQPVAHGRVGTEGDGKVAIQINGGCKGSKPVHFDGAA